MEKVIALEAEMADSGTFIFGGALQLRGTDKATVISLNEGRMVTSNAPAAAAKEQIAGFYIINAADLETARDWAGKVATATNHPIEVRPFQATGRVGA